MWWETGMQARVRSGLLPVLLQLPRLIGIAVRISWQADRVRTLVVAVATIAAGATATFGLLATQQVLIQLFKGGPTPQRLVAALPALVGLAAVTAIRGALAITTGYAQNGLTPRVDREVERRLFAVTTAVRLDAFDADAFADDMERATTGADSANSLVRTTMHLTAGLVSLLSVAGLRHQSQGEITWNGRPTTELDQASVRRRIAVVTQDFFKWPPHRRDQHRDRGR